MSPRAPLRVVQGGDDVGKRYVLDTSALLAYYQDEPGSKPVVEILRQAEAGKVVVYVSFMTIYEIAYLVGAAYGFVQARGTVMKMRSLPMIEPEADEQLMWKAAEIKAGGGLSVADSFIAALAAVNDAVLVHRDPEFEKARLSIRRMMLPSK
ncbi:MAG: type II toxin-antitoxin system VapC family toxin [Armatimonadetes bacterium]|nr:type II toxin-antitoxin system VapC family toxin [Armatimonadota bacterium]